MIKRKTLLIFGTVVSMMLLSSCSSDDDSKQDFPFSADIFHSVQGKRVAFQGLTNSASGWKWDFGDGTTSTEQNPVHVYQEGGYYVATLTATGENGGTETSKVNLALDLPPYALLTGDYTAEDYQGKTWKLSSGHSVNDYFANSDAALSPFDGAPNPLPAGIFGGGLGMAEVYEDEFTFYFDGTYSHDVKADGAAFSGLVFQFATTGGEGIVNDGGSDFGLCTGRYTPEADATFTYVENEDFEIASVYGPGGKLIYQDVSTLAFSGSEFVGFYDFERKVILQNITNDSMRLVMFLAASPDAIGVNTNALVLTFEVVQ
ncbi:PKD domain-containing protein [Pricia sp. S334]|uniref:PKD domain-containing protein n=1 Tax=Pricia mediterranea TaxID=3076079 RepID=A0ABU3L623_9FLAO|nr:PKD domain-containing protein [Pricia sp. S334]MDT7828808.1 PKD domain-containing protein [Pricia sp. S334]